jgi:uncharacterized protein YlxP (DUF503 family)
MSAIVPGANTLKQHGEGQILGVLRLRAAIGLRGTSLSMTELSGNREIRVHPRESAVRFWFASCQLLCASCFSMPIAYLTLEIRIEAAHSLKDKRQVVRSLKDRLRNAFNVSVAEIDVTDLWQRATLGVVSISGSRDYLEGLMRNVEQMAVRLANNNGAEVVDSFLDYVEIGEGTEIG